MARLTYEGIAEMARVRICADCSAYDHHTGAVDRDTPALIHWRRRAMRRTSILRFLWLASPRSVVGPPWLRYYARVKWTQNALALLRVRVSAVAWEHQRATLRGLLARPRDFFFDPPSGELDVTRTSARAWASRAIDRGERAT